MTQADAAHMATAAGPGDLPRSFASSPPFGISSHVVSKDVIALATGGEPAATGAGGVAVPTEDDYLTKLVKYVPLEVLGAYLFLASVITSNVSDPHDRAIWLGSLLVGVVVLSVPYSIRVLGIVRPMQIAMGAIGLATYVFAVGGWFATTSWYHQWYASFVLVAFGLLVAILKLKPLPTTSSQ